MKKLLFLILLCIGGLMHAQDSQNKRLEISKGNWVIGGDLSFNTISRTSDDQPFTRTNDNLRFGFSPNIGYVIGKNTVLGLRPGYSYIKSENISTDGIILSNSNTMESNVFSIASYVRRFFPLGKKFAIYVQGEVGYNYRVSDTTNENSTFPLVNGTSNNYLIGIRPGITYFISKGFALETGIGVLGYLFTDSKSTNGTGLLLDSSESNSFGFELNTSNIFFGLSYYF